MAKSKFKAVTLPVTFYVCRICGAMYESEQAANQSPCKSPLTPAKFVVGQIVGAYMQVAAGMEVVGTQWGYAEIEDVLEPEARATPESIDLDHHYAGQAFRFQANKPIPHVRHYQVRALGKPQGFSSDKYFSTIHALSEDELKAVMAEEVPQE